MRIFSLILTACIGPCLNQSVSAYDTATAFSDGQTFGKANTGSTKGQITSGNATTAIPNYTSSDPASSYYQGGKGSLVAPASGDVNNCTSTLGSADADQYIHGKCEGVRMIMKDPGKKNVMFPLNKNTDPLTLQRNTVKSDPESYLGTLTTSGNYSGCTQKSVKAPDTYTTEVCDQFLKREDKTCHETLTVSVTQKESCVMGTFAVSQDINLNGPDHILINGMCNTIGSDGKMSFRIYAHGSKGACVGWQTFDINILTPNSGGGPTMRPHWGGKCRDEFTSYTSHGCDVNDDCSVTFSFFGASAASVTLKFKKPGMATYFDDTWDDQCAALKARLP